MWHLLETMSNFNMQSSIIDQTNSVAQKPEGSSPHSQHSQPVLILSQSNPIHTPQASPPRIHSDPILPHTPTVSVSNKRLNKLVDLLLDK
jgi:hypothetical protein